MRCFVEREKAARRVEPHLVDRTGAEAWLTTKLTRIIRSPDVRSRLTAQGAEVYTMSPPEFTQFFEKERSMWAVLVKQSGVKFD